MLDTPDLPLPAGLGPDGLLTELVDDESLLVGTPVGLALAAHRRGRTCGEGDRMAALVVPVERLGDVLEQLEAADHALPVVLAHDPEGAGPLGLDDLREARATLLDDDRLDVVGARVIMPAVADPALTLRILLQALDLNVPAAIATPPGADPAEMVAVLAEDGAELLGLAPSHPQAAALLRAAVEAKVAVRAFSVVERLGVWPGHPRAGDDVLAVLAAAAAAQTGAPLDVVDARLRGTDPIAARRALATLDPAAAAALRRAVVAVGTPDVLAVIEALT